MRDILENTMWWVDGAQNPKCNFVEQKIKQGAQDTPTAFAVHVGPQRYMWETLYAIMRQMDYS